MRNTSYKVIGLMSGTSLDGLDIAFCRFDYKDERWEWDILEAQTVAYPANLQQRLQRSMEASALSLTKLDHDMGRWMGEQVSDFIHKKQLKADFISTHGHTVFHQPESGFTLQIGNAVCLHQVTSLPVIFDFRSLDVARGGQGAPLVPIGDELLFSDYDFCLNLGGIANVSYRNQAAKRVAFDICAANLLLNHLAGLEGKAYDEYGNVAKKGQVIPQLLEKWNAFPFLKVPSPKSLGKEAIDREILIHADIETYSPADMLATAVEHIAQQVSSSIKAVANSGKLLVTGGGAKNDWLMHRTKAFLGPGFAIEKVDPAVIDYKEALVFAFLGVLNLRGEINVLKEVTGARQDSIAGSRVGRF